MRRKVATLTLGCKVNQYETDAIRALLEDASYELVDFQEVADVYIVNTCSVTNMAERKSRQMLHKAKKMNPNSVVVAIGCYVQTVPQEVLDDLAVDIVVGNNCKKNIVGILEAYYENREWKNEESWIAINQTDEYEALSISKTQEHTRAYVKIQDGCNQFCSYCIIPYVRGRIRSRDMESICAEVDALAQNGCKEIVLTGIHLSSYGKDWDIELAKNSSLDGKYLLEIIEKLSAINGIERIRLGSLEPRIITEEFVKGLARVEKLCPHFHLSLQSACNDTLKRMNRKYTIEEYMESCKLLRKIYDRPAITTDVIVGFPGETEAEFETTMKNLEVLNLYEIHVFKYSKRRGTAAETMENQVPEDKKNERSDKLLELTKRQKQAYEALFNGDEVKVLIEELSHDQTEIKGIGKAKNTYVGYTERYIKVAVESDEDIINQIVATVKV